MFRNAPDVVFCFDGDRAGRAAAWKALEAVLPRLRDGRQAMFLFLPEGEDPDTLIRQEGAAGFQARLRAATPLSQYLFDQLGEGVQLSSLDGRARLAERARPLLAQIPDGAFADLMQQRLAELTGVSSAQRPSAPPPRRVPRTAVSPAPKRSLVRGVISLLLQKPSLALSLAPPYRFIALRQPGVALLAELLTLIHTRPDITTGAVLDALAEHQDAPALQKLAALNLPGEAAQWQIEFQDAIAQLERQTLQQRITELRERQPELDAAQKGELRELLQALRG